jgi:hypothetical protein
MPILEFAFGVENDFRPNLTAKKIIEDLGGGTARHGFGMAGVWDVS